MLDQVLTHLRVHAGIAGLVFTENIAPALGMSYGGRIAILTSSLSESRVRAIPPNLSPP
jgi:hypothetical protein